MSDNDELTDIPPLVPERDDVASHMHNKRSQGQEIVRPNYYTEKVKVSTWPVRIMLTVLTLAVLVGAYGAYFFYGIYEAELRQANLRISDLETRLMMAGDAAEQSDNTLMENIEKTIEQYDLLWANWRNNNQQFADLEGEIARLKMINEGQNESTTTNSQAIADTSESLLNYQARLNTLNNELTEVTGSLSTLDEEMASLAAVRGDLASIRQAMSSGDSTLLGMLGRLEYIEESMESVNAHRLQINESLFRLQESVEALQRAAAARGGP